VLAVVDRDHRVAGEKLGAEALFELLFGVALADHRRNAPGGEHGGDIDQLRLAGARRRRREGV
jgi:hypothetical protein